ncbi:MAG: hypothetical protein IIX02_06560 [Clostridia bacterium]|nr:hypothetical protein [Clostridia bacterium]
MSLFGKKKLSLTDILKGIEDLAEEEKEQVLSVLQPAETTVEEVEELTPVETMDEAEEIENGEVDEVQESEEGTTESVEEMPVEEAGETDVESSLPVDDMQGAEEVEEYETIPDVPTETPEAMAETSTPINYDELIAAQNARIDSMESAISTIMEKLEQMVSNFDNQNFGYAPQSGDDDNTMSRMNAVMQGYAPRRAEQYR